MTKETKIGVGGAWKDLQSIQVGVGGAWKTVEEIYVGVSGAWKLAYQVVTGSWPSDWSTEFNKTAGNFYFTSGVKVLTTDPTSGTVNVTLTGTGATVQVNGSGGYVTGPWVLSNGDYVSMKLQANASASGSATGTLTITEGGDTLNWTIHTSS